MRDTIHARSSQRVAGHPKELVDGRLLLALTLQDDLLRVGDDDVEARAIQRVE
jgi:hypothetical protein